MRRRSRTHATISCSTLETDCDSATVHVSEPDPMRAAATRDPEIAMIAWNTVKKKGVRVSP